jgi:hypothetical protein
MTEITGYDQALAATLEGEDSDVAELRERLLSGGAGADDRREARRRLDDDERKVFDLAHPSPPAESAQALDAGELEVERAGLKDAKAFKERAEQVRERIVEALADAQPVESLVTLKVRVSAPEDR